MTSGLLKRFRKKTDLYLICCHLEITVHKFCYRFNEGPWKDAFILKGYDPRINIQSSGYQIDNIYYRLRKPFITPEKYLNQILDSRTLEAKLIASKSKKLRLPNNINGW